MAAHVSSGVAVGSVDGFIAGAAQRRARQESLYQTLCGRGVGSRAVPVAVPNVVNRNRIALEYRTAFVIDAVAGDYSLASGTGCNCGGGAVAIGDDLHSI